MLSFVLILVTTTLGVFVSTVALGRRFDGISLTEARGTPLTGWVPMERFRTRRLTFANITLPIWLRAGVLSLITGLVYYFAPMATQTKAWGWGILLLIAMLAAMIYVAIWWAHDGNRPVEFLWLIVTLACMVFAANAAAGLWALGISSTFWAMFVIYVPWAAVGLALVYCAVSAALWWRRNHSGSTSARRWTAFAWIWTVLTALVLVLLLIFEGAILGISPGPSPNPPTPSRQTWIEWQCLKKGTQIDEFGPCPSDADKLSGKELWDLKGKVDFVDPAEGLSEIYSRDCLSGNRYLVSYYNKYPNDTDALNASIWYYATDNNKVDNTEYISIISESRTWVEDHNPTYTAYTASELKEKRGLVVHDQMYMNVYSHQYDADGDEVPAVIVYDCGTASDKDLYLVVDYTVKFRKITEIYHVNCLFQPCNVSEYMDVEVEERPDPEPDNGNTPSGGSNPSGGSDPVPSPTPTTAPTPKPTEKPTPGYNKDPEKAKYDNVEPNDAGSSAGSDTNTGQGSTRSAGQTEQNHGSYDSYKSSYDRTVQDTNAGKGSDSGGGGSGSYAGVDQSTDSGYAADPGTARASGGGNITNNESNPGGVLGGPPD